MKIIKGNLWDSLDDVILVTTNAYVKKDGALVMGRGAAKELKMLIPGVEYVLGRWLNNHCADTKKYGVIFFSPENSERIYGAFQVKYNWWEDADLELIDNSVYCLTEALKYSTIMKTVSMNFPGIGNGRLSYDDVFPIVSKLPDSVSIYMKE